MSTPGSCGVWGPLWPSLETNLASFAPDKLTPSVVVVRLLACGTLDIPQARGFEQLSSQQSGETHAPPVSGLPTSDVAHFGGVRGAGEHDVPWTIWSGSDIPTAIGTYSPTWSEVSKVELYWTLFTAIFGGGSFFSLQNRRIHAGYIDEYSQMFGEICEIFTWNHEIMQSWFFQKKNSVCKEWDWKPKVLLFHQNCEFGFLSSVGFQEWALIIWVGWSSHVRIRPRQDELQDFLGLSEDRCTWGEAKGVGLGKCW